MLAYQWFENMHQVRQLESTKHTGSRTMLKKNQSYHKDRMVLERWKKLLEISFKCIFAGGQYRMCFCIANIGGRLGTSPDVLLVGFWNNFTIKIRETAVKCENSSVYQSMYRLDIQEHSIKTSPVRIILHRTFHRFFFSFPTVRITIGGIAGKKCLPKFLILFMKFAL